MRIAEKSGICDFFRSIGNGILRCISKVTEEGFTIGREEAGTVGRKPRIIRVNIDRADTLAFDEAAGCKIEFSFEKSVRVKIPNGLPDMECFQLGVFEGIPFELGESIGNVHLQQGCTAAEGAGFQLRNTLGKVEPLKATTVAEGRTPQNGDRIGHLHDPEFVPAGKRPLINAQDRVAVQNIRNPEDFGGTIKTGNGSAVFSVDCIQEFYVIRMIPGRREGTAFKSTFIYAGSRVQKVNGFQTAAV